MGILAPMRMAIGVKLIQFMPCSKNQFAMHQNRPYNPNEEQPGYLVRYPDAHGSFENAYESWSPKDVFEAAYLPLSDPSRITLQEVDGFIRPGTRYFKVGEKTCVGQYTLVTGMELTESAACVDPANYDESKAAPIIMGKVRDKLWFGLGFLLQWAKYGLKWQPAAEPEPRIGNYDPRALGGRMHSGLTPQQSVAAAGGTGMQFDETGMQFDESSDQETAQRHREAAERLAADGSSPQQ
jgi:hypothetical protein